MFLKVLKLKKTDEVITTSLNFKAWLMVMSRHNLKIKFCDINIFDLNMNVDDLEKKITRNTRLICPVHMGGISCKVDEIKEIVDYYSKKFGKKIYTIYDSARATGIHYKGKPVGGFGDGEIFSFHGAKLLSTLGEGGMITTNNSNIAKKLREMTSYGGEHSWGMNYRMTKIGAFIGNLQLKRLNKMNEKRIKIARDRISFLEGNEKIILPEINKKLENVFYLFPIILKNKFSRSDRDLVLKILEKDYKIICSIPKHINKRWSFVKKHYGIPKLKNTDFVYDRIFCPIMHPKLNSKQNIFLSAAILKSLRGI